MSNARAPIYHGRFPPEIIGTAILLYFWFPLCPRVVEEMLAARGIGVSHETVRQWARKFGRVFSDQLRQQIPARGGKWRLDAVVVSIAGETCWLWRAVDQHRFVLYVLVQKRRDRRAVQRLPAKLLKAPSNRRAS